MRRKPFQLSARHGIYYVQFIDSHGNRLHARSTGQRDRDAAAAIAGQWLKDGVPAPYSEKRRPVEEVSSLQAVLDSLRKLDLTKEDARKIAAILESRGLFVSVIVKDNPSSELLSDFLTRFWTYETSPYVKDKHAHGQRMGRTHTRQSLQRARKYWLPYFEGKRIGELTRADLKEFALSLSDPEQDLSPLTRNRILNVGTTALRWAFENELIEKDPTDGIVRFAGKPKKRGILSPEEAHALFSLDWPDERILLANQLAATTGLRIGEILALRRADVGEVILSVNRSFSWYDGEKSTKTGEGRRVPLLPELRRELLSLADKNPHGTDGFIFFEEKTDTRPLKEQTVLAGLKEQLVKLKAGDTAPKAEREKAEAYWEERNIVFHSWRHYYSARMADKLEPRKIMRATGHKNQIIFDGYADHALESDLAEVGKVAEEVFSNIVHFTRAS